MARVPGYSTQRNKINEAYRNGEMTKLERDSAIEDLKLFASDGRLSADEKASIANEIGESQSNAAREAGTGGGGTGQGTDTSDDGGASGPEPTDPGQPGDPNRPGQAWVWNGSSWVQPAKPTGDWIWNDNAGWVEDTTAKRNRETARASLESLLKQYGLESLFPTLNSLLAEYGGNETIIMSQLRETEAYKERFKGIQYRINNGYAAIDEATYIGLENDYKKIMRSYGLSDSFYTQDRLADLIGGDVSELEVESRIATGQRMLESSNQQVITELREYYPELGDGDLLSYLLDPKQGQEVLSQKIRAAQLGGAAELAGFSVGRAQAESLGRTSVGQTLDPFDPKTQAQLEGTFAAAARTARRETTLAGIDQEAYDPFEAVQAAFGDEEKRLASERRAKRERARFSGTAGVARSALSQSRNF